MKKFSIFFILSLTITMVAAAQEFKTFKVGLGWGYTTSIPFNNESAIGSLFSIEPAYRLTDDVAIGLRLESALLLGYDFDFSFYTSYTGNVQYYLSASKFRPFVGVGFGLFEAQADFFENAYSKLGFYPRVGFDLGHFNVTLDYNLMVTSNESIYEISDDYLGLRIGFFVGGGRKRSLYTDTDK